MEEEKQKKPSSAKASDGKEKIELEVCEGKIEEYLNGWKRAKADYINLKKEFEKEKEDVVKFANARLVLGLIPVFDNFKRAFVSVPEEKKDDEWLKGFENIKKQFEDFLKELGIEEIKTVGEKFDPEVHEAVSQGEDKDKDSETILEEASPGYQMHGRVIIPAKVVVNK